MTGVRWKVRLIVAEKSPLKCQLHFKNCCKPFPVFLLLPKKIPFPLKLFMKNKSRLAEKTYTRKSNTRQAFGQKSKHFYRHLPQNDVLFSHSWPKSLNHLKWSAILGEVLSRNFLIGQRAPPDAVIMIMTSSTSKSHRLQRTRQVNDTIYAI